MIWFACRQCGKTHGRPENSAGSLIFCDCGQSLMVPWESTAPEPEVQWPAEPAEPAEPPPLPAGRSYPPPPRMVPVPVGDERIPIVQPARRPPPGERPYPERRRQAFIPPRDRNYCFNHQDLPVERTCESCAERFCAHCLATFQGKVLCGPCKNAEVKALDTPPKVSGLAITVALLGVGLSLAGFCLLPLGSTPDMLPMIVFALLLQMGTLGLGALALYRTEKTSLLRGRSLAITGIVAAGVGMLLTVAATFYSYLQWV